MKLEQFKTKFKALKEEEVILSKRNCPTGIGYTLESYLGITENNTL